MLMVRGHHGGEVYVGRFEVTTHLVQGHVYFDADTSTITLKRFYYDGDGPAEIQFVSVPKGEEDYGKGAPLDIIAVHSHSPQDAENGGKTFTVVSKNGIEGPVYNRNVTLALDVPLDTVGRIVVWCPLYEVVL